MLISIPPKYAVSQVVGFRWPIWNWSRVSDSSSRFERPETNAPSSAGGSYFAVAFTGTSRTRCADPARCEADVVLEVDRTAPGLEGCELAVEEAAGDWRNSISPASRRNEIRSASFGMVLDRRVPSRVACSSSQPRAGSCLPIVKLEQLS